MNLADVVGLFGVIAYLGAYGLMQMRVLTLEDGRYALLNVVGGLALIYSLCWNFNLWSFISQVMWLVFTVIGYLRSKRQQTA
jgi:hypothetical protein